MTQFVELNLSSHFSIKPCQTFCYKSCWTGYCLSPPKKQALLQFSPLTMTIANSFSRLSESTRFEWRPLPLALQHPAGPGPLDNVSCEESPVLLLSLFCLLPGLPLWLPLSSVSPLRWEDTEEKRSDGLGVLKWQMVLTSCFQASSCSLDVVLRWVS